MRIKEIEGIEYVAKTDIEAAFKDRISKLSARALQAEETATALQTELDNTTGRLGSLDTLNSKIQELQTQLTDANTRYDRHNAMAQNGFTDPEIREAVEWAYNKAMQGTEKPTPLGDWLASIKADPTLAPLVLRPHLISQQIPQQIPQHSTQPQMVESSPTAPTNADASKPAPALDVAPALLPPKTNTGAQPAPTQAGDILKHAANDIEFYRANRDAVRKAWFNR